MNEIDSMVDKLLPPLHPEVRKLGDYLFQSQRRWRLSIPHVERTVVTKLLTYWLLKHTVEPEGGVGLVVAPSSTMMNWHYAGWRGPIVGHVNFSKKMEHYQEDTARVVSAVFGAVPNYSEDYLAALDNFLTYDGDFCIVHVPDDGVPQDLGELLQKHGFQPMNVGRKA